MSTLLIRSLGRQPYLHVWDEMKKFTIQRDHHTQDEVWLLEHDAVYTQGQTGKAQHILNAQDIPIVHTDRGGQVTYHGPGQLIAYFLLDLRRRDLNVGTLVRQLEQMTIDILHHFEINAHVRAGAPGVYVEEKKIASIGLRVKKGCTYHGVAFNVAMDLKPFAGIHPCGYEGLTMTQLKDFIPHITLEQTQTVWIQHILKTFTGETNMSAPYV